jgi:hypothetical protein
MLLLLAAKLARSAGVDDNPAATDAIMSLGSRFTLALAFDLDRVD